MQHQIKLFDPYGRYGNLINNTMSALAVPLALSVCLLIPVCTVFFSDPNGARLKPVVLTLLGVFITFSIICGVLYMFMRTHIYYKLPYKVISLLQKFGSLSEENKARFSITPERVLEMTPDQAAEAANLIDRVVDEQKRQDKLLGRDKNMFSESYLAELREQLDREKSITEEIKSRLD